MRRVFFIILIVLLVQVIGSSIIFFGVFLYQTKAQLDEKIQHVVRDISYQNGSWNLSLYNNDPKLVGIYPLYFITTDGFVLDRRSPIHGFLDTSDFKSLLAYKNIQTVKSITGQFRRIYVKPIINNKKAIGVIAVSYFDPQNSILKQIDNKLVTTANTIATTIRITHGAINTSTVDVRKLPYDVAFTILDSYNTILAKTPNVNNIDRIPNFIDASYIKQALLFSSQKIVRDSLTGEYFYIRSTSLKKNASPVAVFVVGQSLAPLLSMVSIFLFLQVIVSVCIAIALSIILRSVVKIKTTQVAVRREHIFFSEKKGALSIDGQEIEIPYATNQFYLLQMLFSRPQKRWEMDELLERFGEEPSAENSRKVYDAMLAINKKVEKVIKIQLIFHQSKTYQLNPQIFASK